ncbi:uncharacterized protein RHOBADRAFT_51240, partial [Rhodotorula graminis WP1]
STSPTLDHAAHVATGPPGCSLDEQWPHEYICARRRRLGLLPLRGRTQAQASQGHSLEDGDQQELQPGQDVLQVPQEDRLQLLPVARRARAPQPRPRPPRRRRPRRDQRRRRPARPRRAPAARLEQPRRLVIRRRRFGRAGAGRRRQEARSFGGRRRRQAAVERQEGPLRLAPARGRGQGQGRQARGRRRWLGRAQARGRRDGRGLGFGGRASSRPRRAQRQGQGRVRRVRTVQGGNSRRRTSAWSRVASAVQSHFLRLASPVNTT